MPKLSKHPSSHQQVLGFLTAIVQPENKGKTIEVRCKSEGSAIRFRQLCYAYRKRERDRAEKEGRPSPFENIILTVKSNVVLGNQESDEFKIFVDGEEQAPVTMFAPQEPSLEAQIAEKEVEISLLEPGAERDRAERSLSRLQKRLLERPPLPPADDI